MLLLIMGVAGAGKTTLGRTLSERLGWPFLDADDFHPPENVAKMRAGQALDDADRLPWLRAVAAACRGAMSEGGHVVLACSALRGRYRDILSQAGELRTVFLRGDADLLAARLRARRGHYAGASLLPSQIEALEPPEGSLDLDAGDELEAKITAVRAWLSTRPRGSAGRMPRE